MCWSHRIPPYNQELAHWELREIRRVPQPEGPPQVQSGPIDFFDKVCKLRDSNGDLRELPAGNLSCSYFIFHLREGTELILSFSVLTTFKKMEYFLLFNINLTELSCTSSGILMKPCKSDRSFNFVHFDNNKFKSRISCSLVKLERHFCP